MQVQAGTTRSLYYVELGVCRTFAEMHYNTDSWLRKKFLTQSMEAYEFGVVLGLAPIQRLVYCIDKADDEDTLLQK